MLTRSWAVTVVLAIGIAGCAPTAMVTRERPAEINLRGVKRIAVIDINGSDNDAAGAVNGAGLNCRDS